MLELRSEAHRVTVFLGARERLFPDPDARLSRMNLRDGTACFVMLLGACTDVDGSSATDGGIDARVASQCPADWEDPAFSDPCAGDTRCWYPAELMCFGEEEDGDCVQSGYEFTCRDGVWDSYHEHVDAPLREDTAREPRQRTPSELETSDSDSEQHQAVDAGICEGGACEAGITEAG